MDWSPIEAKRVVYRLRFRRWWGILSQDQVGSGRGNREFLAQCTRWRPKQIEVGPAANTWAS